MKYYIYLSLIAIAGLFIACDKDETDNISIITTYPEFTVEGAPLITVGTAGDYEEPGVSASDGKNDLVVTTTVTGKFTGYSGTTLGANPDIYTITYTAVNTEGLPDSTQRTVVVLNPGDLTNSIAGAYNSKVVRVSNGETHENIQIFIWNISGNTYGISHGIGGFYSDGRMQGDRYRASGATISVNDISTNDFSYTQGLLPAGPFNVDISDFIVNEATKTITFTGDANFSPTALFDVTMTQQQPE